MGRFTFLRKRAFPLTLKDKSDSELSASSADKDQRDDQEAIVSKHQKEDESIIAIAIAFTVLLQRTTSKVTHTFLSY